MQLLTLLRPCGRFLEELLGDCPPHQKAKREDQTDQGVTQGGRLNTEVVNFGDVAQQHDPTVVSEAQGSATIVGTAMLAATREKACVEGEGVGTWRDGRQGGNGNRPWQQ